jgi:hypothetical protein
MDNNADTGIRVTSGGETIGADKVFWQDYQGRNAERWVNNYDEVPERLKVLNDFYELGAGNISGTGWYMISNSGFADNYFTRSDVRAIATVDSFEVGSSTSDITYLGLSDITPAFTIHPF